VSALSRDTWTSEGFDFPFEEILLCFLLIDQGPLSESCGARFGSTSHLFGHSTPDHDSLFRLPALREARRSNQPNGDLQLHQGGPRAALHANQLRVVDFTA